MGNRNALRELSKRFPSPPELSRTFELLRDDTDRSVAIVAASIADNVLERLLIRHMKQRGGDLLGFLFGMRGPLGDFHSKILIAEAFGAVSPVMAQELNRIRAIRNVFAHATTPVSFKTPEIAEEMTAFAMLNAMDGVEPAEGQIKLEAPRDKAGYLLVVHILCIIIDSDHRKAGGDPILSHHGELASHEKTPPPPARGSSRPRRIRPSAGRPAGSSQG